MLFPNGGVDMADEKSVPIALTLYADMNVDFADALVSVHISRK